MWTALKPFRRLTHMVSPHADPFGEAAGAVGDAGRRVGRSTRQTLSRAAAAYHGGIAAAAVVEVAKENVAEPTPASDARSAPAPPPPRPITGAASEGPPDPNPSSPGPPTPHADDYVPPPPSESVALPPTEAEWVDGEEVYPIYRPSERGAGDDAA